MTVSAATFAERNRTIIMEELRRLMPGKEDLRTALPCGLATLDSHLPQGGLTCGSLHEIVPETGATAAAFGFTAALLYVGTVTVISLLETTVNEAVFPSTVTLVAPVSPLPVTVTNVPTGPLVGLIF